MSVATEITRIQNAKASLKSSINAKTDAQHKITDETIDEYSDFVDSITSGGGGTDWSDLGYSNAPNGFTTDFNYGVNIKNNWDATQTDLQNKFQANLDLVYMPSVDCSNATTFRSMFANCSNLQSVGNLHISSNATSLRQMFNSSGSNSRNLEIDFSNADTSNVTTFYQMFNTSNTIKELDLSSFTSDSATTIQQMFFTMKSIEKIDIRKFVFSKSGLTISNLFSNSSSYFPPDCLIIVKDNTEKTFLTTNFSFLTNVKTVAEYEAMQ